MRNTIRLLLATFLLSLAAPRAAAQDQDYVIKLERPGKVGDKFDVKITAAVKRERTQTVAGKALPPQ